MSFVYGQFLPTAGNAAPMDATASNSSTAATERIVYEISRLRSYDDERLPVALIAAAAIALVAVVW